MTSKDIEINHAIQIESLKDQIKGMRETISRLLNEKGKLEKDLDWYKGASKYMEHTADHSNMQGL